MYGVNATERYEVYRDGDMAARLAGTRLRLTAPHPYWWAVVRRRCGWSYGGPLHVWAICSHRLRRPVGPAFVRSVRRTISTRAAYWRSLGC